MIDVIKYDDGYPVSVIIPLSLKRKHFFENFVFPLIEAMMPREIIINDNASHACKKRNEGFKKSTQPYVLFSDDDILYPKDFLKKCLNVLEKNKDKGYAYTGYKGIVLTHSHPLKNNYEIKTEQFNPQKLKKSNYISTMSLIKREHFIGFDENLKRYHDWDLWLSLLKIGVEGIAVPNNEFFAYYLDEGITSNTNNERDGVIKIIKKHELGTW